MASAIRCALHPHHTEKASVKLLYLGIGKLLY